MKEFPMNGFPKAAQVENFPDFLNTVCSGFQKPVHVATSVFWESFHDCIRGFLTPFPLTGVGLAYTSSFLNVIIDVQKKLKYLKGKLDKMKILKPQEAA
jgi:hypothetical protein